MGPTKKCGGVVRGAIGRLVRRGGWVGGGGGLEWDCPGLTFRGHDANLVHTVRGISSPNTG